MLGNNLLRVSSRDITLNEKEYHYMTDLIVIGAGPAGITAALEAARLGANVSLITAEPVGGRANWASLLPSKVYLTAADHLGEAHHNPSLGLSGPLPEPDLPVLRARIAELAKARSTDERARLEESGVKLVPGKAQFVDPHTIEVTPSEGECQRITFQQAIIASGSVPVFPPDIRPDGRRILAPRLAGSLAEWPSHMIVVGGGVTGAEFAYFFNRMGADVTWVTDVARVLPRVDSDMSELFEATLVGRGVTVFKDAPVTSVQSSELGVTVTLRDGHPLTGSHGFLALGRRPDLTDLGLEASGVETADMRIVVDNYGRTTQPHIYAVGDAAGAPFIANRGQAQARIAARHAGGADTPPFRPDTIIEAVYTQPQLAQVGLTEADAAREKIAVQIHRGSYAAALKPHLSGDTAGFVKILAAPGSSRILGAGAVGDRAAELLAPVAVAIAAKQPLSTLADIFLAYPSLSEVVGLAARSPAVSLA
ncbi:MAG: NAD(P)/FAD-dependent oxidoreductase [Hyphomicrobiales bacterium]|nr:NAD(P)/FAD-dependent oxidoreductase [Hyphomicrobiales bacterium]